MYIYCCAGTFTPTVCQREPWNVDLVYNIHPWGPEWNLSARGWNMFRFLVGVSQNELFTWGDLARHKQWKEEVEMFAFRVKRTELSNYGLLTQFWWLTISTIFGGLTISIIGKTGSNGAPADVTCHATNISNMKGKWHQKTKTHKKLFKWHWNTHTKCKWHQNTKTKTKAQSKNMLPTSQIWKANDIKKQKHKHKCTAC